VGYPDPIGRGADDTPWESIVKRIDIYDGDMVPVSDASAGITVKGPYP